MTSPNPNRSFPSRRKPLRRWFLAGALAVGLLAALMLVPNRPGVSHTRARAVAARHESVNPSRRVYRYSVIPGGASSPKELEGALAHDRVAALHYAGLLQSRTRLESVARPRRVFVSYRIGDSIYWTRKRVSLPAGEAILTDGVIAARTRCGNRVADTPQSPTHRDEPSEEALNSVPAEPLDLTQIPGTSRLIAPALTGVPAAADYLMAFGPAAVTGSGLLPAAGGGYLSGGGASSGSASGGTSGSGGSAGSAGGGTGGGGASSPVPGTSPADNSTPTSTGTSPGTNPSTNPNSGGATPPSAATPVPGTGLPVLPSPTTPLPNPAFPFLPVPSAPPPVGTAGTVTLPGGAPDLPAPGPTVPALPLPEIPYTPTSGLLPVVLPEDQSPGENPVIPFTPPAPGTVQPAGAPNPSPTNLQTPEPQTLVLALLGSVAILFGRRFFRSA